MKNWKTTLLGLLGGTSATTALAALASPDFMKVLQDSGVSPIVLIIIGGVAKIVRDICAKDAESKVAAPTIISSLLLLLAGGCTPLISSNIQMGCGQDKVSLSNKADTDQTNTPKTDVSVPVSVVPK